MSIQRLNSNIMFPATQHPSDNVNVLDDYEEGTYIPTLTCSTSGGFVLNTDRDTLSYVKIGKMVTLFGEIYIASADSPNGDLIMTLPFEAADLPEAAGGGMIPVVLSYAGAQSGSIFLTPGNPTTSGKFYITSFATGATTFITNANVDTSFTIYINGSYIAAA